MTSRLVQPYGWPFHTVAEGMGLKGKALEWSRGYLSDRRQRVCIGEARSELAEVKRGMPQGSILGPLLFILYANNLPQVTRNSTVTQHTDDTTMMVVVKDEDLKRVRKRADDNKLLINTRKTQLLLTGRKRRKRELSTVRW